MIDLRGLFLFYPRLVAVLVLIIIIFGGSAGLASAAKNSLPGSRLYPVKIALERTGLKFAPTPLIKTKIQIELAGERLAEAKKVADSDGVEKVNQALEQFQNELSEVASILELKQMSRTTPKEAGELSHHLIKKSKEYKAQLKNTVASVPEPVKRKAAQVQKAIDSSSMKAMELMAASAKLGGIEEEKAVSEIQEKLEETEAQIKEAEAQVIELRVQKKEPMPREVVGLAPVQSPVQNTDQAKEALNDAKELLEANDLTGAVSKVKESMEIMNQIQDSSP